MDSALETSKTHHPNDTQKKLLEHGNKTSFLLTDIVSLLFLWSASLHTTNSAGAYTGTDNTLIDQNDDDCATLSVRPMFSESRFRVLSFFLPFLVSPKFLVHQEERRNSFGISILLHLPTHTHTDNLTLQHCSVNSVFCSCATFYPSAAPQRKERPKTVERITEDA